MMGGATDFADGAHPSEAYIQTDLGQRGTVMA